jgi:hypothetical protein
LSDFLPYPRPVLLGDNLLVYLLLAFGGAMAVGSALALVRPPDKRDEGDLERPPVARSVTMIVVGAIAAVWALASLLSK